MSNCPYSLSDGVPQDDDDLPVKCVACGSIRKRVHHRGVSFTRFVFPSHKSLDGTPVDRDHWEQINGVWQIVRKVTS